MEKRLQGKLPLIGFYLNAVNKTTKTRRIYIKDSQHSTKINRMRETATDWLTGDTFQQTSKLNPFHMQ